MNPWSLWLDPWENYIDAWSKALGGDIFRLHSGKSSEEITARHGMMPFRVAIEGDNFALLDFSNAHDVIGEPVPTLIVTPYALHDWRVADLAHGHSIIETLAAHKIRKLYVLAWKSANFKTRHNRIDAQFEALKSVEEHFGRQIKVVGLCQGGWLSLAYAAQFPNAFSRIALIGAPVDFKQSPSAIRAMDDHLIDASINWLSLAGGGVIRGWSTQSLWRIKFGDRSDRCQALQETEETLEGHPDLAQAYDEWDVDVLDLPPAYFGDVLKQLYRDNEIAEGCFHVLGQCISLSAVKCPMLIMVGRDDDVVPENQIAAISKSVLTPKADIKILHADGSHLALFLGRKTLSDQWPKIARWLQSEPSTKAN